MLYAILAGLATPLVLSVHSVVSWDFAMSVVPGWHTTIFAPYFVAGAIFSGCAMVLTLSIPMRRIQHLQRVMPIDHFEMLAKVMLLTSMIVAYAYTVEFVLAYYSGNVYEFGIFADRATGHYKWAYWIMVTCNVVAPGFTETDMTAALSEPQRQAMLAGVPVRRPASSAEVAAAVVYLASDEAAYITGHTLRVNGGMHM